MIVLAEPNPTEPLLLKHPNRDYVDSLLHGLQWKTGHTQEAIVTLTDYVIRLEAQMDNNESNPRMPYEAVKMFIWLRDGCKCAYCQGQLRVHQVSPDHLVPYSQGGLTRSGNLITSCRPCNIAKSTYTPEEYLERLAKPDGFAWRGSIFRNWVEEQNLKYGRI